MIPLETLNAYVALGRPLFPCRERPSAELKADGSPVAKAKQPLTPNGFKDATLDPDTIAKWHAHFPGCVWSTPTSAEYGVVDIDPRHKGDATWADLIQTHGPIPECPTVATGGGGTHYVFRFPSGTRKGKLGAGIDLQADGGYVVLPPSRVLIPEHADAYRWTVRLSAFPVIPDAPQWLVALARREGVKGEGVKAGDKPLSVTPITLDPANPFAGQAVPHTLQSHPGAGKKADGGEGQHDTFVRLVGAELRRGVDPEQVKAWAEAWAGRCVPAYGEWEGQFAGLLRAATRKGEIGLQAEEGDTITSPPTGDAQQASKQVSNSVPPNGETGEGDTYLLTCLLPEPVPGLNSPPPSPPCKPIIPSGITEYRDDSLVPPAEPDHKGTSGTCPLHPDAYHGVLGEVVQAVSPHTEADDPALLVCLLTAFGSAVGFAPHFDHGKRHGCNLFAGLVGPTASRKGTATGIAKRVIADADPEWEHRVQHEGFGSGEGLIWSVRDPNPVDPVGIPDKRLLVVEEEWAKAFTLAASDKSILTPIIRNAYDRIAIGKANKGDNAYGCKEPHVSIVGNITPDDLRQSLTGKNAVSIANGFLNRFLLVNTRRTKFLPRGGRWKQHADPFTPAIRDAITTAKSRTLLALDADAEAVWDALYADLERRPDGVAGAATARASDMVMKLAMVYALADGDDAIRLPHLRAGQAVWRYCEATAFALFGQAPTRAGEPLVPEPDPLFLRLLNAITSSPGVKRSALTVAFKNTDKADAIGVALEGLRAKGWAYSVKGTGEAGGAPAERWYPGSGDGGEPSGEPEGDNGLHGGIGEWGSETVHPNLNPNPFAGLVVGGGEEGSKQVSNPPHPDRQFLSGDAQKGSKQVNNPLPDPSGGDTYLLTSLLDTPPIVTGIPVSENSSNPEPVSTPTPLLPRVDHDPPPPATLEPGTRLTKDRTGRTVRDCVNPTTVDVKGMTVDSFLEATYLWRRTEKGVALTARGVANAGEVVDWFVANRKAIVDRVKADAERDTADTAFLEALDGA